MQAEGHDLVRRIVADISAAEPGDAGARAPAARNILRLEAEGAVILWNVADAAKAKTRKPARREHARDMEEGAVEGVKIFAHLFDEQHMAGKVRLEGRAEQHRQCHQIERGVACAMLEPGLARCRIARDEPVERALYCALAPLTADIGDHRSVRDMIEALAVETGEKIALVGIAEKCLAARRGGHRGDRIRSDAARAIAAAREPERINVGAVRHFDQGGEAMPVFAREMAVHRETLFVKNEFDARIADRGNRAHGFGVVWQDRSGGGDNTDPHDVNLYTRSAPRIEA